MNIRGAIEVETLLKVVLALVVVWLVLEVLGAALRITTAIFRFLTPLIGLVIVVLIVLWLFDRI